MKLLRVYQDNTVLIFFFVSVFWLFVLFSFLNISFCPHSFGRAKLLLLSLFFRYQSSRKGREASATSLNLYAPGADGSTVEVQVPDATVRVRKHLRDVSAASLPVSCAAQRALACPGLLLPRCAPLAWGSAPVSCPAPSHTAAPGNIRGPSGP